MNQDINKIIEEFDELIKGSEEKYFEDALRFCSCYEGDFCNVFPEDIAKVKTFLSQILLQSRAETLREVGEWVNHQYKIHEEIERTHERYPKDWHAGNRNALADVSSKIKSLQDNKE